MSFPALSDKTEVGNPRGIGAGAGSRADAAFF